MFKFHHTLKLDPGASTTVWSLNEQQHHEPPNNIVMKGKKWLVNDIIYTSLTNSNGEVINRMHYSFSLECIVYITILACNFFFVHFFFFK